MLKCEKCYIIELIYIKGVENLNIALIRELLEQENLSELNLKLISGDGVKVQEIDDIYKKENLLYVTEPNKQVVNLDHVTTIEISEKNDNPGMHVL